MSGRFRTDNKTHKSALRFVYSQNGLCQASPKSAVARFCLEITRASELDLAMANMLSEASIACQNVEAQVIVVEPSRSPHHKPWIQQGARCLCKVNSTLHHAVNSITVLDCAAAKSKSLKHHNRIARSFDTCRHVSQKTEGFTPKMQTCINRA